MRPSYDAEHPHSTTPIYDELYSEYRRLFRALPGDRSGEEDLRFTGFAVRDGYPLLGEQRQYLPQQQAFHTHAGQPSGLPQFTPAQSQHTHPEPTTATTTPTATTHGQSQSHGQTAPQFTNGQGWVAAGYLGPLPHATPAPPPTAAPVLGTATGLATAAPTGGRHRQMLSLPPGRAGDHH
ncbi:hypothetical protein [Kitasatospora sp. NPDC001683]